MGIKLLSKFLKVNCNDVVRKIQLSELRGKKICIDASIYLYRYKSQDALIEKFYLLCSIFRNYNIVPIFIFDGKPSNLKNETIKQRREMRDKAWEKYQDLKEELGDNLNKKEKDKLENIKRSFIRIKKDDVTNIKELLTAYGIKYIDALGEADVLCSSLIRNEKVYAVMTEDMDMFAYGCPVILRYFSLANHTCMLYNIEEILEKLDINIADFQTLCILSGTDYNNSRYNIFNNFKLYQKYKNMGYYDSFKQWLEINNYIENINGFDKILNIYKNSKYEIKNYPYTLISYGKTNTNNLFNVLSKERFIFV